MKLIAELDTIKLEKKRLQAILSQDNDDKKKLADKINTFTVIGELERFLSNSKEYWLDFTPIYAMVVNGYASKLHSIYWLMNIFTESQVTHRLNESWKKNISENRSSMSIIAFICGYFLMTVKYAGPFT